jgi:hypothetical protein
VLPALRRLPLPLTLKTQRRFWTVQRRVERVSVKRLRRPATLSAESRRRRRH